MIGISLKTVVEARVGKYGPYLAMGRKQLAENRVRWVFLSATAVKALKVQDIDDLVNLDNEGTLPMCGSSQHVVVSLEVSQRDLHWFPSTR